MSMTTEQATAAINSHLTTPEHREFWANCYYHTLSGYDAEAHRLAAKIIDGYQPNLATIDALARAVFAMLDTDAASRDLAEVSE
jgi:hypothetical protein